MAVLGSGNSNGGCSLLHAAGIGYGASLALDLPVRVRLLDKESKRALDDPDGLLEQVLVAWKMPAILFRMVNCTGLLNLRFLQDRA